MIVQRITVKIRNGKFDEALKLAKDARSLKPGSGRLYSSIFGTFNTVAFENEFENMAEHDKFWEEMNALAEWAPFMERWNQVTVDGESTNELWNLEDS